MAGIVILHAARDGAAAREIALTFNGGFAARRILTAGSPPMQFGPHVVVVALWSKIAAEDGLGENLKRRLEDLADRTILCTRDDTPLPPAVAALPLAARVNWSPSDPIQPMLDSAAKVLGDTLAGISAPAARQR